MVYVYDMRWLSAIVCENMTVKWADVKLNVSEGGMLI